MARFDGRVAIVTGAGSGIGRQTALRLASEGASVACLDVTGAQEETVAQIESGRGEGSGSGGSSAGSGANKAQAIRCDVADESSVKAAVAETVATLGAPNIVCNVAGIGRFTHTEELATVDWEKILAVNVTGPFLMCRETIPYLLENGGNVVNVASTAGLIGQPYSAAYCASKGGVIALTKALAVEYLERGVRFNAVAPGGVDTPILTNFMPPQGASNDLMARLMSPMGFAKAEEIAALIAFIVSDEARYMSGSVVAMDGGITA